MHIKPQSIKKTCFERYIGQIVYYWSKKGPHTNYQNKKLLATYNTSTSIFLVHFLSCKNVLETLKSMKL